MLGRILGQAFGYSGARDVERFKRVAMEMTLFYDEVLDYKQMAKWFNVRSDHTVKKYVDALRRACLIEAIPRYSPRPRLRQRGEKAYMAETGFLLCHSRLFYGEEFELRLARNVVCNELLRATRNSGMQVSYFNDGRCQVDFVVSCEGRVLQLLQVILNPRDVKAVKKRYSDLRRAGELLGCGNLRGIAIKSGPKTKMLEGIMTEAVYVWAAHEDLESDFYGRPRKPR